MGCLWTGVFSEREDIAAASKTLCRLIKKRCEHWLPACCVRVGHFLTPKYPTLEAFVCCLKSCCIFECSAVCCALMLYNWCSQSGSQCSCQQSVLTTGGGAWNVVPASDMSIPILPPVLFLSQNSLQVWSVPVTQPCADIITANLPFQKARKCTWKPRKPVVIHL